MSVSSRADLPQQGVGGHAAHLHACPWCGGSTYRITRRTLDLLISVVVPVRRYRCRALGCSWEGNLRFLRPRDGRGDGYESHRTLR